MLLFFYWYNNSNIPQGNIMCLFPLIRFSQGMTSQCMELCVSAGSRCFWIAAVIWRLCWKQTISRSTMSSPPQHWWWKTFRRSLKISGTVTNITPLLVCVFFKVVNLGNQSSSTNKQYGIFNTLSSQHLIDFSLSYCYPNSIIIPVEEVQLIRCMKQCCNLLPVVFSETHYHYQATIAHRVIGLGIWTNP